MDSPNSDLSDYASDYFPEEVKGRRLSLEHTPDHEPSSRPSKRSRLNTHVSPEPSSLAMPPPDDFGEISEDTDGSVPASPHHPGMSAEDDYGLEQVTVCKWDGCTAGDLDDMDNLVQHLHEDHIGTRQKKYSCEWSDCNRKGHPHASGYALRAHMRSHTREKPFYCTLPECDRSFTRSDALAKHMRTVHETEALRPSDPVPKHHSSNPMNKYQRLKLVLSGNKKEKSSTPASPSSHQPPTAPIPSTHDADYAHNNVVYFQDLGSPGTPTMIQFPPDINFTEHELSLPAPDLFRLLRRQLHWAQEEGEELRAEAERLEKKRKEEWVAKELLFENYMEAELSTVKRRRIESTLPDDTEAYDLIEEDIGPSKALDIEPKAGKLPWWRTQEWVEKMAAPRETKEDISKETTPPQAAEEHPTIETEQAEKA